MRTAGIALVLFALAGVHGAELLNSDFEDLKRRLVGPPLREAMARRAREASRKTVSRTTQHLKPSRTAMLSWNAIRG